MTREEIIEYPYEGTITRVIAGKGMQPDDEVVIYEGVMDEHMANDEIGWTMQTSKYIISIPLVKGSDDIWVIPRKGDRISITRYGDTFELTVDNADPSQLGGVSIYATRSSW